jgi:succinate dehydrogenase / fumarate reductase cytochrome b subunit
MLDSRYRFWRRLHALSGALPVALFLIFHFATNAVAIAGPEAFNRIAARLDRLPWVGALEIAAIAVPILFHIVIGVLLGNTAQGAGDASPYSGARTLMVQRVTGGFLVVFAIFHVWGIRLAPELGQTDLFTLTRDLLQHRGLLVFYGLGVLAASIHFGIGLLGSLTLWDLPRGPRARRAAVRVAWCAAVVMALTGGNALLAFVSRPARWLEPKDLYVSGSSAARSSGAPSTSP